MKFSMEAACVSSFINPVVASIDSNRVGSWCSFDPESGYGPLPAPAITLLLCQSMQNTRS